MLHCILHFDHRMVDMLTRNLARTNMVTREHRKRRALIRDQYRACAQVRCLTKYLGSLMLPLCCGSVVVVNERQAVAVAKTLLHRMAHCIPQLRKACSPVHGLATGNEWLIVPDILISPRHASCSWCIWRIFAVRVGRAVIFQFSIVEAFPMRTPLMLDHGRLSAKAGQNG